MANKIYVGTTKFRVQLTGGVDITGGSAKIQYKTAKGTTGEWTATVSSSSTAVCYHDNTGTSPLTVGGPYRFWLELTFSDNLIAYGEPYIKDITNVGE